MTAIELSGVALAEAVEAELIGRVEALMSGDGPRPGLGTILVGDDGPSASYVRKKHEACQRVGIVSHHTHLPETATPDDVMAAIAEFNAADDVDAFIVQLPLPSGCDETVALLAVDPDKDADGLHPVNLGRLVIPDGHGPVPCTPAGIQALLAHNDVPIEGRHVVIVGRGLTIGRPLALLLSRKAPNANAAVTVVHTGIGDLASYTTQADILVAAAGRPSIITPDMVKPGAAVVSAGISWDGKRLIPDVDEACAGVAGWITPRLGGVGPTTVALLLRNTVDAAERRHGAR